MEAGHRDSEQCAEAASERAVHTMAQSSGVEHSVHIQAGKGEVAPPPPPPEKQLNGFVNAVVRIERVGNALGTLAFTWATVVLLGGYASTLRNCDDFWFATAIFFLEALRMFSRNNRMDYELFFGTRGAFTPFGLNGLILIVYLNGLLVMICRKYTEKWASVIVVCLPSMGILVAISQFFFPGVRRRPTCHPLRRGVRKQLVAHDLLLRRWISLWRPMVAIILVCPFVAENSSVGRWTIYAVLLLAGLMVTISRMKFPGIIKLADHALGDKQEFWRRLVLYLCMIGAIGIVSFSFSPEPDVMLIVTLAEISTVVLVSFGNFQIPAAIIRVVLPLIRLKQNNYNTPCEKNTASSPSNDNATANLAASLDMFYGMVLGQGALYLAACVLEVFSIIPRRCLFRRAGFRGQWGEDSIKMYYKDAMQKCMERNLLASNVLAPEISLCNFAIDSLNSDKTKRQLHGIRIAHVLLQRDPTTRTRLLAKLTTETMTRLMRMLDWTGQEHETIRLFATKVINEIAKDLLIVTVPGMVQNVSLLLDSGVQQKRGNPLLDTYDEQEERTDLSVDDTGNNQIGNGEVVLDTRNLLETQDSSTQQVGTNNEHNSWIARRWRQVFEFWSIPQEGPLTEQDILPVLGMSIIENLAIYDQSNCEEISKVTDLIRKITRFTRFCRSDSKYTDAEKRALVDSSLKLFHRLTAGIDGEVGITLRQKIAKHPFLLRNLSDILGDITSFHEARKLAARILRNLAVDASTRKIIGRAQLIITRLMRAFLTPDEPSSTDGDRLLRKVAGQALAMLAIDNVSNCLAMLREDNGYSVVKELTTMIHVVRYRCVAASLLQSVCMHAWPQLKKEDLEALSYISPVVLERILRAEGAELEIFIGLSSHIYKAIPEEFAQYFEYSQIKETFVKQLVVALNANMEPGADCPGIRRVILEQAINLMEHDSRNVNCFHGHRMMEAVLMVEETMLEAENYNIFLGDVGLMEAAEPLSSLVARAKQLLAAVSLTRQPTNMQFSL